MPLSSFVVWDLVSRIFPFTIANRLSMGFRSSAYAVQSSTGTPWAFNQVLAGARSYHILSFLFNIPLVSVHTGLKSGLHLSVRPGWFLPSPKSPKNHASLVSTLGVLASLSQCISDCLHNTCQLSNLPYNCVGYWTQLRPFNGSRNPLQVFWVSDLFRLPPLFSKNYILTFWASESKFK